MSMPNTAVASGDAVQVSSDFGSGKAIGVEAGPVFADLKACCEKLCCAGRQLKFRGMIGLVQTVLHPQ